MPIVPFSKLEGVFRTGNLSSDNLEKKLGNHKYNFKGISFKILMEKYT
jgi:hypothetical protein